MLFCYFFRVYSGMSRTHLSEKTKNNINKKTKKIKFSILKHIVLDREIFDYICGDLLSRTSVYNEYTEESIAGKDGIWKCIVLENSDNSQNVVLYTGGLHYPIYAAIWDATNNINILTGR